MRDSQTTKRQSGMIITTWTFGILALLLLFLAPGQAFAQQTCNANINYLTSGPSGGNWFVGDEITVDTYIRAGDIEGGNYLDIPDLGFALDCEEKAGLTWDTCFSQGHLINFDEADIVADPDTCRNDIDESIEFPPVESNKVRIRPANGPLRLDEGEVCKISWKFTVSSLNPDKITPFSTERIDQVVALPFDREIDPAVCDNGLGTSEDRAGYINMDTCAIEVEKEICAPDISNCELDENWHPADDLGSSLLLSKDGLAAYRAKIKNTGSVPFLGDVMVDDTLLWDTGPQSAGIGILAPGQEATIGGSGATWSHLCTSKDPIGNTLSVAGQCRAGVDERWANASDDAWGDCSNFRIASGGIRLEKTGTLNDDDGKAGITAGDSISYQFTVTNTSDITLSNVTVVDDDPNVTVTGGPITLAPFASDNTTFKGSYTITQADIDAGSFTNWATATGQCTAGNCPVSDRDPDTRQLGQGPAILLTKTGTLNDDDGKPGVTAGDTISYAFTVKNTGNVTLTNVTLEDTVGGVTITGSPIPSLAPGASNSSAYTGSYTVTQTDINKGSFTNVATATGTPPTGPNVTDPDNDTQDLTQDPKFEIEKEISINDGVDWEKVTAGPVQWPSGALYRITITNTGNVDLPSVVVSDQFPGLPEDVYPDDIGPLLVGETVVISGDGSGDLVWTALDVDVVCDGQESITNVATAVASWDPAPITMTDDATLVCDKAAIKLVKEVGLADSDGVYTWYDANIDEGDTIPWANYDPPATVDVRYRFRVSNVSVEEVDLLNVVVTDPDLAPGGFTANVGTLVWNEIPVEVPIDNVPEFLDRCDGGPGLKTNLATASGESELGTPVEDSDPATVRCVDAPAIEVIKEVSSDGTSWSSTSASGIATSDAFFRFKITNIGDAPLKDLVVSDSILTITTADTPLLLAGLELNPGDSVTLVPGTAGAGEIYWEDLALAGSGYCDFEFSIENEVTAAGASTITDQVVSDKDTATFTCTVEEEETEICYDESTGEDNVKPFWIKMSYDADNDTLIQDPLTTPIIFPDPAAFPSKTTPVDIVVWDIRGTNDYYVSVDSDVTAEIGNDIFYVVGLDNKQVAPTTRVEIYSQCVPNADPGDKNPDLGCGDPIQTIEFHTSCSQPLNANDEFGGIGLESGGHEPL